MILPEDLRQLLLAFNAHRVEYLIVGGWAVGISAEHLIQNKLKAGRLRDLADVEAIREANRK